MVNSSSNSLSSRSRLSIDQQRDPIVRSHVIIGRPSAREHAPHPSCQPSPLSVSATSCFSPAFYGLARRIEQISGDRLTLNAGTLYPLLLRLEQEGAIASERGPSENNRRARFYRLTTVGRKQLQSETRDWAQTAALIDRFFAVKAEDLRMRTPAAVPDSARHVGHAAARRGTVARGARGPPGAADGRQHAQPACRPRKRGVRRSSRSARSRQSGKTIAMSRPCRFVEHLLQDTRVALRRMKQAPAFTAAAIATLALGLGLNSAVLSLAYALFLKPLPVDDASRLVFVDQTLPGDRSARISSSHILTTSTIAITPRVFTELAAHYSTSPMNVVTLDRRGQRDRAAWSRPTISRCCACSRRWGASSRQTKIACRAGTPWRS